jgi:hypothetical protein
VQRTCVRITVSTQIAEPEVAVRHDGTNVIAGGAISFGVLILTEIASLRSQ